MAIYNPSLQNADRLNDMYTVNSIEPDQNNITCFAGGSEMLRIAPDGFYVRGKRVPTDDQEAQAVYQAFKEFLTWSQLTRKY